MGLSFSGPHLKSSNGAEPGGSKADWAEPGLWNHTRNRTVTPLTTSRDFSKDLTSGSLRFLLCEMGMQQSPGKDDDMPGTSQALSKQLFLFFFLVVESINTTHCYTYYRTVSKHVGLEVPFSLFVQNINIFKAQTIAGVYNVSF